MEIKLQPQFNLFPFYTKIKTSILLHLLLVRQVGYNKCSYLTYYEKYKRNFQQKFKNCHKLEREMKTCF